MSIEQPVDLFIDDVSTQYISWSLITTNNFSEAFTCTLHLIKLIAMQYLKGNWIFEYSIMGGSTWESTSPSAGAIGS